MRYFKILIISLVLCITFMPHCNAEEWKYFYSNQNKSGYLDVDSIIEKGDSIFFNVQYKDNKTNYDIVATIQYKNGKVGVAKSCTFITYDKNKNIISTKNANEATNFKYLSGGSLLYPMVMYAQEIIQEQKKEREYQEKIANEKVNWEPYIKNLEKKLRRNWNPPYTSDRPNRTVVHFVLERINDSTVALSNNYLIQIVQTSGLDDYDFAAIKAIKKTSYDNFPIGAYDKTKDIEFTFDYDPEK